MNTFNSNQIAEEIINNNFGEKFYEDPLTYLSNYSPAFGEKEDWMQQFKKAYTSKNSYISHLKQQAFTSLLLFYVYDIMLYFFEYDCPSYSKFHQLDEDTQNVVLEEVVKIISNAIAHQIANEYANYLFEKND